MTPKLVNILEMCIAAGVQRGWQRARKHETAPTEDRVKDCIEEDIMFEIYEWFTFEEKIDA
jgi:hypothetical protein